MADIALIYGFGHRDLCDMDLYELERWRARSQAQAERMKKASKGQ